MHRANFSITYSQHGQYHANFIRIKKLFILTLFFLGVALNVNSQCDLKLSENTINKGNRDGFIKLKIFDFEIKSITDSISYKILLKKDTHYRLYFAVSDKYKSNTEFLILRNGLLVEKISMVNQPAHYDIIPNSEGTYEIKGKIQNGNKSCGIIFLSVLKPKAKLSSQANADSTVFTLPDEMPEFIIGEKNAFSDWVAANSKFPEKAEKKKIQGKIYISFVVDKEGYVKNVQVIRGIDPEVDAYFVEVLKKSPKWQKPGKTKNKPVNVYFTVPIGIKI